MKKELKNQIIFQVFTRNFTKEGTFKSLINKLDYIKDLGTDIVYLLPINPIGEINRKGDLGSPYSISDYETINPELGSLEDFKELINATHTKGMKIMIDIVFNHTSYASKLFCEHHEWFYKTKTGKVSSKCEDWSDVIDLNYENNEQLVDYLIGVLTYYKELGVDGFRFDVVSLLGENFFIKLRDVFLKKYPSTILLGEAIDAGFLNYIRKTFKLGVSDNDLFNYGFDVLYQYNTFNELRSYLETNNLDYLTQYKILIAYEGAYNPINALRLRCIENHDQKRLIEFTNNILKMHNLAAFSLFMKGPALIYNGLETKADHHLSLFTKDLLDLSIDEKWFNFIKKLILLKKSEINLYLEESQVDTSSGEHLIILNRYQNEKYDVLGIFNLTGKKSLIKSTFLVNGLYKDLISDKIIEIKNNEIETDMPLELVHYEI